MSLVAPESVAAQDAPTTRPTTPQGSFELVEWVVILVDPNRQNANELGAFKSTVPGFSRGRREAPANPSADLLKRPSPVGVIRLINRGGDAAAEESVDVLLQVPAGRFLGQWPQGKPKGNRQLWEGVAMREGVIKPVPAEAGHWFETLRQGDASSAISTRRWTERFLMYDAELKYPNALRLKAADGAKDAYQLANAGEAAMRDVEVYVPAPNGWRVAGLAELAATKKPIVAAAKPAPSQPQPATAPTAEVVKTVFEQGSGEQTVKVEVEVKSASQPVSTPTSQPATQASTKPTTAPSADVPADAWRELKFAEGAKTLSPADAVAAWKPRLEKAGLTPPDVEVILATLRTHALDADQLTAVYRMEQSELDRLLPLEVVPQPAKVTRVGLAIVTNIDPAAGDRIAKLIEQLGNPQWDAREAAHTKLAELGAGAKPKLTEALKHKDIEVVYRVERLLETLNTTAE